MVEGTEELDNSQIEKLKEGNISLIIEDYNDLFSDFDPRSYSEKAISDDFLQECKRAARDKGDGENEELELRILVPKKVRNLREEWKIKKRLKEHFSHHFRREEQLLEKTKRSGIKWVGFGVIILAGVLLGIIEFSGSTFGSLLNILEVPSWFLIWEGMGKILIDSRKMHPEYEFYKKMSKAEVNFTEF